MNESTATTPIVAIVSVSVAVLAALTVLALYYRIGVYDNLSAGDIPILLLPIVPYLTLIALAWRCKKKTAASIVILLGTSAISGFGTYIYFDVFVLSSHHTSTEALIFLFIPIYQGVAIGLLFVVARALDWLLQRTRRKTGE